MISIIIPVYNSEGTVENCLDSLLNQSYNGEYEIIVVNDGSTDNTVGIVERYPVKLLAQQHRGPATARNLGAKETKGDLLLFIDSDCVADSNWVQEMTKPFENSDVVGVQGSYRSKQFEIVARFAQYEIEERYEKMGKNRYIDFIGSYSAGYRRDIFLNAGGFDENFPIASGEDADLSFRLSSEGYKMVFNPNAIVYHKHPDSLFEYLNQKFYRAYWRVLLYKKNYQKTIKESYTPQMLKVQIGLIYLFIFSLLASIFTASFNAPLLLFAVLLLTTFPLSLRILKKDIKVGLIAPIMLILRSIVLGAGLGYGVFKNIL